MQLLEGFRQDVSHQEMGRIVSELEEMFFSTGADSLPVEAIGNWLCMDLGYIDQNEFEDAIHGTFLSFLHSLPHVEVWEAEDVSGGYKFKIQPKGRNSPRSLSIKVDSREKLWRTCLLAKSPAKIRIEELEFEIQGGSKTLIDSIYNHISANAAQLEKHTEQNPSSKLENVSRKIRKNFAILRNQGC